MDYIINPRMFSPKKLIEKLGHFDLVISYSLFKGSINFINHVSCPVVWLGFGFDYYPLIVDNTNSLFLSKTASLYYNYEKQQNKKLKSKIKKIIKRLFPRSFLQPSSEQILQLIRLGKISFFAPIIKPEYDILKNKLMINYFPEYIDFSFGSGMPQMKTSIQIYKLLGIISY